MISINQVSRYYGSKRALNKVSFEIPEGETVGILGPNGSGKTTLINILLGLLRADSGFITVDGMEIWSNRERILPRIGAIIEIPRLYPLLTGVENLKIFSQFLGISDPEKKISEVLSIAELTNIDKIPFKNYSLGMKQRLGIALSLLNDPSILVFDEPTNGLDPEGIRTVREVIRKLAFSGKTILLCSHLIHEVEQVCKSVVILQNGNLRKEITSEELENREKLYHLQTTPDSYEACIRFIDNRSKGSEKAHIIHSNSENHSFQLNLGDMKGSSFLERLVQSKIQVEAFYKEQVPLEELFMEAVKND